MSRRQVFVAVTLLVLVACAPTANLATGTMRPTGDAAAGFLLGLWHGLTVPFMFIWSLFNDAIGVYETHNTGWPYNLGFVLGVLSIGGGAGAGSKKKRTS